MTILRFTLVSVFDTGVFLYILISLFVKLTCIGTYIDICP
nr:MAG TPA: hypothetical protein [Caudoviricetes sp.]